MSLTDLLASTLECPVCYDVPRSKPIFQCENGHLICKDCRAKLKDCPICKTALRDCRNLTAEKVLEKLPVLCRFSNHGCTLKFASEDRIEHEKICPVREVRCPFPLCQKKFCIKNLFDHDPEHRKDAMASREGFRITISFEEEETTEAPNMYWAPNRCIFQEKEFYAVIVREFKLKLWIIWVYLVGTREEARKYNFEVIVENGESSRLTFTSPVSGIDDGDEVIQANGDVSCFPDLVAKRFWVQDKRQYQSITFMIKIKEQESTSEIATAATGDVACKHGCGVVQASDVISGHEKECPVRQIVCPILDCKKDVCVSNLLKHFSEDHKISPKQNLSNIIPVNEIDFKLTRKWCPELLEYVDGNVFLSQFYRNHDEGMWYKWVYLIGPSAETKNYKIEFTLYSTGKDSRHTFNCFANPLDIPISDVIKSGSICCFNDFAAKQMWDEKNFEICLQLTIFSTKLDLANPGLKTRGAKRLAQNNERRTSLRIQQQEEADEQKKPKIIADSKK